MAGAGELPFPRRFSSGQPEEFVRRYFEQTFLGRMGDKDDLGGSVIFLLSEAARYITGVNLPVDGGIRLASGRLK